MSFCVKNILTLLFIPKTLRQFYITFLNWHHTLPQYLNHFFRKHKQDCTILVRKDRFPIYTCSSWLYFSVQSFSFVFVFVRVRLQFKAVSRSMKGDSNQCMHDWVDPTEQKKSENSFYFSLSFYFFSFFFYFFSLSHVDMDKLSLKSGVVFVQLIFPCTAVFTPHTKEPFKCIYPHFSVSMFVLQPFHRLRSRLSFAFLLLLFSLTVALQFFLLMLKAWESERRKTERDRNFKKLERKIKRKRKKENLREREGGKREEERVRSSYHAASVYWSLAPKWAGGQVRPSR